MISHDFCVSLHLEEGEGKLYQVMVLIICKQTAPQLQCKMFCTLTIATSSWKRILSVFNFGLVFFSLVVVD